MNAWSKLPNAKHIDWVLESIVSNSDIWIEARSQVYGQAFIQAYGQAVNQARKQAREQAYNRAVNQVWNRAYGHARGRVWDQVLGVLIALVVYDDCDQYLSMTIDELKIWAVLSEKPQAVLLLPMKWVQENECLV